MGGSKRISWLRSNNHTPPDVRPQYRSPRFLLRGLSIDPPKILVQAFFYIRLHFLSRLNSLLNQRLEDLITIVMELKVLSDHAHNGEHSKTAVVDLLVLVVNPSLIAVVNPVGGTEDVSGLVSGSGLDLLSEPFDGTAAKDELEPTDGGELSGGLQGVGGELAVEGGVDAGGGDVPSEAGGHGHAPVLELGLTVHGHGGVILALRKAEGVEEADGGGDTDDHVVLPAVQGGGGLGNLSRSKGRAGFFVE